MSNFRKFMAILLSACMVFSFCAFADEAEVHPGEGATKIGIILGGNKEDYGFNYGFYKMAEQMEEDWKKGKNVSRRRLGRLTQNIQMETQEQARKICDLYEEFLGLAEI